ncbi:class II aldolase/adducin family protein [Citreicella sp. C3M06]|uniref:class II aldolase/adducin family protein n=1 Tax=Citreicella sp. C3M06 TaxID=2841564 RepID=UPI001C087287|nr:class II aldolase/adducin family protein [Citreicella sp. C3M06]MBU2960257.1 class II aldolase/adducin family protein [Citreicella sp. C3M06]
MDGDEPHQELIVDMNNQERNVVMTDYAKPEHYSDTEWEARVSLAAAYRMVARLGLDDLIYNHISLRVPGTTDQFLINPYGLMFNEITASSLVKINTVGDVIEETAHTVNKAAFVIHAAVHKSRADAHCVLHTHSDASTAVSGQPDGLLPLSQFAMRFYNRQGFHAYEGVAIDEAEQQRIVAHLADHPVMLMRNHGILTCGRTPGEAFMLLYYFERAAKIQLQMQAACASGIELVLPSPEVCEKAARQFWELKGDILIPGEREWPGLMRDLDRVDAGYRA